MTEIADEIERVHRAVGSRPAGTEEARTVLLRRTYGAGVADVWAAVTSPGRIGRWFLPVSGAFEAGGHYQLEGNAGGGILACDAPRRLRLSWLFGPEPGFSEVEVRLAAEGSGRTAFELEHAAVVPEEFWGRFGPGAVGVGWDLALLGLGRYLADGGVDRARAEAWQTSPEALGFMTRSGEAWGAAYAASGADPEAAAAATAATIAFYTGT
ncbi:SRPBCC family protein [Streptomyces sp. NPDC006512]|uniref:SRPBCC family protein n=1 Tax=Streptomyces sp. NPDC006512 TaxID=3154307 RepID=UPI0033A8E248